MTTVDDQTDINNNTDKDSDAISPSKTSPITVPILTPVKVQSPCTSPHQSPSASLDQVSDSEDFKDDFSEEEQQPKSKRPPGAVRRRNERERNRVKHINRTFSVLRQHLPTRKANKKLSKVETLRSAVDYIKHLRQLLSDHDSLTAAISLEHALIAHNQQQRLLQQQQQQQQIQQQFQRLPQMPYTSVNVVTNQGVPLISPTGSVNTVNYSPIVSPNYQQDSSWEQNSSATDAELMDLAAESCITDIELW